MAGYPVSSVPLAPWALKNHRSSAGISVSARPEKGRSSTPLQVWKVTPPLILGWWAMKSTTARTSGSEVGYGPAPSCSNSWRHSAGKLRFRSSPSRSRFTLSMKPS